MFQIQPSSNVKRKTQTNMISQSRLSYRIPAELGTCYLSPAYQQMYKDEEAHVKKQRNDLERDERKKVR